MKKKSNTTPVTTSNNSSFVKKFEKDLKKWQDEWKKTPEYKKRLKRRKDMKHFLKTSPLYTISETGPCHTCLIHVTCNKSFFDGSACKKYKEALKKFLKDQGWYKNGGRQTN